MDERRKRGRCPNHALASRGQCKVSRYYVVVETHENVRAIRGGNHTIEVRDGCVCVHVFKREDVGLEEGARFARELSTHLARLVEEPDVVGLLMDVRDAPTIAGPKTRGFLLGLFEKWEMAMRPLAIVVGDQSIKEIQFQNLVSKIAPRWGRVMNQYEDAERWCQQRRVAVMHQDG